MHDIDLILTLTGGLAAALVLGFITQQLRLSPIVGYLLAGIVVGPATPGFQADRGLAEQLAEIGVILLMFGVGLHFHFRELLAVRRVAAPGALVQSGVATRDAFAVLFFVSVGMLFDPVAAMRSPWAIAMAIAIVLGLGYRELPKLQRAGAEDVFAAEGEAALAFAVRILERLGATGEQIDRERQRVEAMFRSG